MKPEPGIYPKVPFEDYSAWDAVNHSILKHFRKTPAHARDAMLHQNESTKYQDLGHTVHMALLEPEEFKAAGPLVAPKLDRRTTAGKIEWKRFEASAQGRPVVTESDLQTLRGIITSVSRHATARDALYGRGVNELSIVWVDPDTGVLCKGRIDRLCEVNGQPCILDLKTMSKPATTHSWQQAVETYGYHEQAAHYLRGLHILRPLPDDAKREFLWLVAETESPYCVRVFQADEAAIDIGRDEVAKYMKAYADCQKAGAWPGWPEGLDLAGLPPWAYKRYNVE